MEGCKGAFREETRGKDLEKKGVLEQRTASKDRMANLELLRCLAMMMVVVLHYLGKGQLLGDVEAAGMGTVGCVAWLLESFCIVAVNVYMLISGYFLSSSSFKLSRLLQLLLQVWLFSVGVGLLAVLAGILPGEELDTYFWLRLVFPVSMGHYWFITAYVFLYLLLPFLATAVRRMTERQLRYALIFLLVLFCLVKSVLPVRLEMDAKGYDSLWYVCVFLAAAYLRKFGVSFLQKRGVAAALYILGCLGSFGELMLLHTIYLKTGSLGLLLTVSMEYNHIFPLLAAVGLFALFLQLRVRGGFAVAVRKIAPYTLGVYLLHENLGLRYVWPGWLGADGVKTVWQLVAGVLAAVAVVFTAGILVDMARGALMRGLYGLFGHWTPFRRAVEQIRRVDDCFREKWNEEGREDC